MNKLLCCLLPKSRVSRVPQQASIRVRALLLAPRPREFARNYGTIDQSSGSEVVGLSRRRVEAMLKKVGFEPEFPSPNLMRIHLPGMSHGAFDTQGQRQIICYLMKLFDHSMLYLPLPTEHPDDQVMLYMLNYEMNIHTSLYDDTKKWPLVLENKINYVKRSSFCCQVDVRQTDQSVSMVSARFIEINIDPATRRPAAIPQRWKEENGFPDDEPKPVIDDATKPNDGVLEMERRIHYTDTDENNHTNFVVYVRLCLDTLYECVLNDKYSSSSPMFLRGWIKNVKITFKSETALGDMLTVASWVDGESPNTFHFEIRKGPDVAATVSLSFYSSLTDSQT